MSFIVLECESKTNEILLTFIYHILATLTSKVATNRVLKKKIWDRGCIASSTLFNQDVKYIIYTAKDNTNLLKINKKKIAGLQITRSLVCLIRHAFTNKVGLDGI